MCNVVNTISHQSLTSRCRCKIFSTICY